MKDENGVAWSQIFDVVGRFVANTTPSTTEIIPPATSKGYSYLAGDADRLSFDDFYFPSGAVLNMLEIQRMFWPRCVPHCSRTGYGNSSFSH